MSWFRTDWSEILKGLDIMGQGGAVVHGNARGDRVVFSKDMLEAPRIAIRRFCAFLCIIFRI